MSSLENKGYCRIYGPETLGIFFFLKTTWNLLSATLMSVENRIVTFSYTANNRVMKAQHLFSIKLKGKEKVSNHTLFQQVTVLCIQGYWGAFVVFFFSP